MNVSRTLRLPLALLIGAGIGAEIGVHAPAVQAGIVTLDLCPAGTTSNKNIYGTVLSGGGTVANWSAASYRDYEFRLATTTGSETFDEFSVLLSAQLKNGAVAYGNQLRISLWTGAITASPNLADALTTITVANNLMTSSGYSPKIALTGSTFAGQSIGTSPSTFFFRLWAEGSNVQGYQTKMATTIYEWQSITMTENLPGPPIDGGIAPDVDGNGTIDGGYDPFSTPASVPEIDPAGLGSVLGLVLAVVGMVERRRARIG